MIAAPNAPLILRSFDATDSDYAAIAEVRCSLWPDDADVPEAIRAYDLRRDPKTIWGRIVAERSGKVVGFGYWWQEADMYHPQKFFLGILVRPEEQQQGAGRALYTAIREALEPHDPLLLRCWVRSDQERGMAFAERRGFAEVMRDWESRLNVAAFDPAIFVDAEQRVREQGIVIKTMAELADDPDRDRKLYDLDWAITQDMPAPDTLTEPGFEHFERAQLHNPDLLPDAWFVALDGDRYVGVSNLWKRQGDTDLNVGATGVLRAYRRRGIALALKLRAVAYAKAVGAPQIRTWNASNNRPMLSINEALGFAKQPQWITYALTLRPEE